MTEALTVQDEQLPQIQTGAAVNVWADKKAFDQTARAASMLSKSTLVPQAYQGKPEDCFIAVEMAARMGMSPVFVMQNLNVVRGRPAWTGQACIAMVNACGRFRDVKLVYTGKKGTDERGCYLEAVRVTDGEVVQGTEVTMKLVRDEGWISNTKWKNMPEQMLGYRAASFFARLYCPEALMGLQTQEEVYDAEPVRSMGVQALNEALKTEVKEGGGE